MKKVSILLIAVLSLFAFTTKAEAKVFTLSSYYKLGINHAYVVGDYIFNLDHGWSPTLRDIMIASRTIPEGQPTQLNDIYAFQEEDYFEHFEVYTGAFTWEPTEFKVFEAKYVYKKSITNASSSDYTELD